MSRGFGRIEREIIEVLDLYNRTGKTGPDLAGRVTGEANSPSVRRALKRLEAKGVIAPLAKQRGRLVVWTLDKKVRNKLVRERWQEKNRVREQKKNEESLAANRPRLRIV